MPDLESRLRADARRRATPDAPSLDVALDAVIAVDSTHGPTRRRGARVWLTAAAAVLLVVGLATFLSIRPAHRATSTPADGISPPPGVPTRIHEAIYGELVLVHVTDIGAQAASAVPGNASKLGLWISAATSFYDRNKHKRTIDHECAVVQPKVRVHESSSTVRLTVSGFQYLPVRFAHRKVAIHCVAAGFRKINVNLPGPLGRRTLVTRANGKPVIVSDTSDRPRVGFVPPGFHLVSEYPPIGWMGTLTREYSRGAKSICRSSLCAELTVDVGPPLSLGGRFGLVSPRSLTTVNGYPATMIFDPPKKLATGGGCVTWHERPSARGRQVCMLGGAGNHVTAAVLLEVARGLR